MVIPGGEEGVKRRVKKQVGKEKKQVILSVCVSIPMSLRRVDSQTDYLWSLQSSVRVRVLVTLIVAEGAIIQRAPATTELYMEGQIKKDQP